MEHIKVSSVSEAWRAAARIFPTDYEKNEENSKRAGYGIPFRLVCDRCYQRIMSKGYDGEYYTEADEQIEDDY